MRNLHQSWMVVGFSVGIITGVVVGLIFRINYFASPVWLVLVAMALVFAYFKPKLAVMVVAVVAGMILAFFKISNELAGENYIREFFGENVVMCGVIDGDPDVDEKGVKIKLSSLKFGENGESETAGTVYVSVRKGVEIKRGDEIKLRGKMDEGFGTYAGYMYQPEILNLRRPEPGDLVVRVRDFFAERIRGLLPGVQGKLGLSYLLGMKSGLPDDLNEELRTVGLVHIVVASGAHLSILVEIARKIFGRLSRFAGLLFSILFIVFFMIMVGWTPSIMRAGVMSILSLVAWYVGRKIAAWRLILMVAAGTLLVNPNFIVNLGWLLSFASYGGIMILGPRLTKFFYGEKKPGFVASMVMTTVAATLMTLPIILYYYGQVSLISLVANILILPTLSYAMGLVFMVGVFAGVPVVEAILAFVATKLLDYHIFVVEFLGKMEQFLVKIEPYQPWVFGIYVVIGGWWIIGMIRKKNVI